MTSKSAQSVPVTDDLNIIIKDDLTGKFKLEDIARLLRDCIPARFLDTVDVIYVGAWPENLKRKLDAHYRDGAIFVTNQQDNLNDLVTDIIHEIAHAVLDQDRSILDSDPGIEREFASKRKLFYRLATLYYPEQAEELDRHFAIDPAYSQEFDDFLHKKLGYRKVNFLMRDAVLSPYSLTSFEEYFAEGFQHYFFGQPTAKDKLAVVSPALNRKFQELSRA